MIQNRSIRIYNKIQSEIEINKYIYSPFNKKIVIVITQGIVLAALDASIKDRYIEGS